MSRNSRNLLRIHCTCQSKRTSLIDKIWTMHYVLRTAINKVSSQKVENSQGMLRPCFSKKAEFVAGVVHLQMLSRFGLWPLSTWPIYRKNHSKLPSNHHDHHAAASQNHNFTLVFDTGSGCWRSRLDLQPSLPFLGVATGQWRSTNSDFRGDVGALYFPNYVDLHEIGRMYWKEVSCVSFSFGRSHM